MLIKEAKDEARKSIIRAIDRNGLIEYSVKKVGDDLNVTGDIKVYVKKDYS